MNKENIFIIFLCFAVKILALVCCTVLAIFFQKWWIIIIGILCASASIDIHYDKYDKDEDKED